MILISKIGNKRSDKKRFGNEKWKRRIIIL